MDNKYGYIYEFPNGLRQEPNKIIIRDAQGVNTHFTYIAKHSNWKLLVDSNGIFKLLFESKNNLWKSVLSKESRMIDTSETAGIGQLYENLLTMFTMKQNHQHSYMRVVDTLGRTAVIYNYGTQSEDGVLREIVQQIYQTKLDFVRLHTTPQGFAIAIGKDQRLVFSTLKKAVPPTTITYFLSKIL